MLQTCTKTSYIRYDDYIGQLVYKLQQIDMRVGNYDSDSHLSINPLRLRQNAHHFADIFKSMFL